LKILENLSLKRQRRNRKTAKRELPKDKYNELVKEAEKIMLSYAAELKEDISWFCKKFDYRYDAEPWGNSKDAVERALRFINGSIELK
jgi:hypothetical protein